MRDQLAAVGKRPDPADFATVQDYLDAWDWVQEIVKAEALLRNCRAYISSGRSLDAALDTAIPLIDSQDRLVSVEGP